jgi:methyltransferase (TIGR00027 family)
MATDTPVSHVSDTARWVALYRAMESERPDALFHDPYARRLAGEQGETILDGMKKGRKLAWPMIVRTAVMDEIIERSVNVDGYDAVVNLGSGLDTRPYRLNVPPTLKWFNLDLPDVVGYMETQLAGETPRCALEYARVDLTDLEARRALFQRIGSSASRVLVISEGLLIYLAREQVAALSHDLNAPPTFRRWMIDIAAPRLLKMMQRTWGKQLRQGNAPLIFAPQESSSFFDRLGGRSPSFAQCSRNPCA